MTKVGRFITDPKAGAYCQMKFDSGEKIVVNHDKGGFHGGRLTIEVTKFLGFSSDRIFTCDLESGQGREALTQLTGDARPGSVEAPALGALVKYITDCRSVDEVKHGCALLMPAP